MPSNEQLDALCTEVEKAIERTEGMRLAHPSEIGSVTLNYCRQGWQANAKVIYGGRGRKRISEVFGTPCGTAEEAAESLISSLDFWAQSSKK